MRSHDAIGIGLSGLCLAHCLALPLLVSLGPALVWMQSEWVHLVLAGVALLVTLNAMRSWPRGLKATVLGGLAAAGLGLLLYGALGEIGEAEERLVTVAGACLLALAHATAWIAATRTARHWH